jgi:hypothetical protein
MALTWKIDDITFYDTEIPATLSDSELIVINGSTAPRLGEVFSYVDVSGLARMRRIGMYSFNFSTSKKPGQPAYLQDVGGRAGPNFISISEDITGKIVMNDIHGAIAGQFISENGVKRERTVSIICPKEQRLYINDLYTASLPFSITDPQGDFGNYIIKPGTLRWRTAPPESLNDEHNYLWSGTFTVQEE